jgi:hypothetical protein
LTPEKTFICKLPPVRINLSEALQIATDQKWSSTGQPQGNMLAWMRFSANFSLLYLYNRNEGIRNNDRAAIYYSM